MLKRGQVTVFVVIGLVVLAVAIGIFFLVGKAQKENLILAQEQGSSSHSLRLQVEGFVQSCMEEKLIEALDVVSTQGGLLRYDSKKALLLDDRFVGYGFIDGQVSLDEEEFEKNIAFYVDLLLPECTAGFVTFEKIGVTVTEKEVDSYSREFLEEYNLTEEDFVSVSSVTIKDDEVDLQVEYPLQVQKGDEKVEIDSFSISLASPLGRGITQSRDFLEYFKATGKVYFS